MSNSDCPGLGSDSVGLSKRLLLLPLDKAASKPVNAPDVLDDVPRTYVVRLISMKCLSF